MTEPLSSEQDSLRNPDGTLKKGVVINPEGIGGLQERPEDINIGGRKLNINRVSWWYDVFGRMREEDVKRWNNPEPEVVTLIDGEEISKKWKSGFSVLAYNTFIRAGKSLKDTQEVTDRTEGKAPQELKHSGTIEGELVISEEVKDAIKKAFRENIRKKPESDSGADVQGRPANVGDNTVQDSKG